MSVCVVGGGGEMGERSRVASLELLSIPRNEGPCYRITNEDTWSICIRQVSGYRKMPRLLASFQQPIK